jgi:hypothetical protein
MAARLSKGSKVTLSFFDALPELRDKLLDVANKNPEIENFHAAFVYMIAELFESTQPERFTYTDGKGDGGIDFFVKDSPSYSIYQCKCPEIESLTDISSTPTFDQDALEEINSAIHILQDPSGEYEIKDDVKRLRSDFQRDLLLDAEAVRLTATIAVFGELTTPARAMFESHRSSLLKKNVSLRLIEWKDIYNTLHALASPADIDFEINISYEDQKDLLAHHDYCYVLANAYDFSEAFRTHEWNLFEWNVRLQIHNSSINKRIVETLTKAKGRKEFHHYNNGLLITCKKYKNNEKKKILVLTGPQIINGCQTVRAICEAYDDLTPELQKHFRDNTKVQVKIIKTTDPDFIGQLVISTNDQNPMNPRNLKSNTSEQRDIQQSFRALPSKWFYERKDGEFKSLAASSSHIRWFHKSDFAITAKRFRQIDNQDLAKCWYAFIGHADQALRGGISYFENEPDGVYEKVFTTAPLPAFWSAYRDIIYKHNDDLFEKRPPSTHQYLLAYSIAKFIDTRRVSFQTNRAQAIERGMNAGALSRDPYTKKCSSTAKEMEQYLATDDDYFLNIMINNMREVLIELFSFVLTHKYTGCDSNTCRKIIDLPQESEFINKGLDPSKAPSGDQTGSAIFGPIFEYLRYCTQQYYYEFQAEIKAAPRLKSYLAQRATINKFRDLVIKRNNNIKNYDRPWKLEGKSFLDSLPSIT